MQAYHEITEAYEKELIEELATEKFSWSSIWKAIQLTMLTANS